MRNREPVTRRAVLGKSLAAAAAVTFPAGLPLLSHSLAAVSRTSETSY